MNHRICSFVVTVITFLCLTMPAQAKTDWQVRQKLQLDQAPVDMLVSPNSKWIYILTAEGQIVIYSAQGQLKDTINVGPAVDQIKSGPRDDMLFLLSRSDKSVQVITIDFKEEIATQGSPAKGPPDAPVTVAVFSDFQWPYCARLVPVLEQVLEQYPQQVRVVFKHFPLRNHQYAYKAAQATMAADRQGKFWEFHDALFKDYNRINDQKITEIMTSLNLDADRFQREMQDPAIKAQIDADLRNGNDAGVRGTPTVFINGRLLRDRSLSGFQRQINQELQELKAAAKSQ